VSRYTPPSDHEDDVTPYRRRSLGMRIGVWALLVGVLALVFVDVLAALI
jgi:predicted anti-sigma-YlaC factor YlaD